ncbi:MAG: hypothetical protein P8182_17040, partial [Deltaproteobacteria bacterium]
FTFDEIQRDLWPALVLMRGGRADEPSTSLLETIRRWLTLSRPHAHDDDAPERLKSPASARDVTDWLHAVWNRLDTAAESALFSTRQSIMGRIVRSGLSHADQARLLTAMDYLYRLSTARRVARSVSGSPRVEIPFTESAQMQRTYRRLVELAATDLPLWLSGEKGTELERAARLIHRLRGLGPEAFRVWDTGKSSREASDSWSDVIELDEGRSPVTVLARSLNEVPERFQRQLYDYLVQGLGRPQPVRVIVTASPATSEDEWHTGIYAELFAFLAATRLKIPPLRARICDLAGLITYFARSRALEDPIPRFTPTALEVLQGYHWPGNVEELNVTADYILQKRPAGPIRVEDLPETILAPFGREEEVTGLLEVIHRQDGFRVLRSPGRRQAMAHFLAGPEGETFSLLELQKRFDLGRETARRLLAAFTARGLVHGEKGARGKRITRYRRADLASISSLNSPGVPASIQISAQRTLPRICF